MGLHAATTIVDAPERHRQMVVDLEAALAGNRERLRVKKRTASNQLGFAVLMCGMRFPGRVLDVTETPPAAVLAFIADQVGVPPGQFATYRQRPTNRRELAAELTASLGCRAFDTDAYRELLALAVSLAQGTPRAERLVQSVIDDARSRHILLPTRRAIDFPPVIHKG